jgi:hypothetical protein
VTVDFSSQSPELGRGELHDLGGRPDDERGHRRPAQAPERT